MLIKYDFDHRFNASNDAHELIKRPVVVKVNKFTEQSAGEFAKTIDRAHETGQTMIPVVIDSYGGHVYALLSMIDTMKRSELPITTIIRGKAMSCGSVLAMCGAKGWRFMAENATLMLHDVSTSSFGKANDLKVSADECERLNKIIYEIYDRVTDNADGYFDRLVKERNRADWYFTAQEALQAKLIDQIGMPILHVEAKLNYTLI